MDLSKLKQEPIKLTPVKAALGYYSDRPQEYDVSYIHNKGGTYVITIDDAIEHVSQFHTAIQVMEHAKEEDTVEIRLSNCPGGIVDGGDTFIHAMRNTEAHIRVVATGGVHSMATQILLNAGEFELSNGFNALIHTGSGGAIGNTNEYYAKSKFDQEFRVRQFRDAYEGFLTEQEIDDVINGKDIWLDAEGWVERSRKANEYFANKIKSLQDEVKLVDKPKRVRK